MCVIALTICRLFKCTESKVYIKPISIELTCGSFRFVDSAVEALYSFFIFASRGKYAVVTATTKHTP